ncbi:MAG: C_GCAxxG_C_C family protein [Deltaproteobacteria bacterium]|nr:C_GCAxxG_C_C family protein [Deltaproteobacteria bacterium]
MNLNKLDKYKNKAEFIEDVKKRAFEMEVNSHGCSQVVVQTFLDVLEQDNLQLFMAASPFAAGMSLTGNNCGALIGGLMILGTVFGRKDVKEGLPGIIEGIRPMRKLVRYFSGKQVSLDCRDITGTDLADPEKSQAFFDGGGLEKCAGIIADASAFVAGLVYDEYEKRKVGKE